VLSVVAGLTEKTSGTLVLAGKELRGAGPDRGVVFQAPSLLPWMTAFDNVLLGVEQVMPTAPDAERRDLVAYYLGLIGLKDAMHKMPAELSQGHAAAGRDRPGVRAEPEDAAARRAVRHARLAHPVRAPAGADRPVGQDQKTALMVTHDVDEALFLADRVVMMTNGPRARVGQTLEVTFPRPRNRTEVMEHPDYYRLRERLISFLEEHDIGEPKATAGVLAAAEPALAASA
jgi:ABC-type nitrate/sulfonate/bicarbonate transport system ATPase subunit